MSTQPGSDPQVTELKDPRELPESLRLPLETFRRHLGAVKDLTASLERAEAHTLSLLGKTVKARRAMYDALGEASEAFASYVMTTEERASLAGSDLHLLCCAAGVDPYTGEMEEPRRPSPVEAAMLGERKS